MEYRLLGKSSLNISRIGFGCMSLDSASPASGKILQQALYLGINYFDTADMYQKGLNEELLGKAFKGLRDKVIIASKAGNQWRPDGSGWDWNASKKYILQAAEASLRRLQTDYIDLYQLHGGTIEDPIDETIEAFELLKAQGKIRYYGISSIRPNVIREYISRSQIVSVMMQYSLLDRRPEEEMLNLLQENQVGVLARGSLAKGLLVSKPATPFLNYDARQVKLAADAIRELSDGQRGPTQTALQLVLRQPGITAAVVGMRTSEQLREAVATIDSKQLNPEEMEQITKAIPANMYEDHR
ncbi:MAG: aldo/keto reductase [Bacteroidota bacterium]|nr:aldo/keto reductase [Bacteroidota bacterium]MDP4213875.1 aldo/keto reductase [Bacteroidota bacterium]MDP4251761.1 aldo/keto reductase [Bacteroidota bacterium]